MKGARGCSTRSLALYVGIDHDKKEFWKVGELEL